MLGGQSENNPLLIPPDILNSDSDEYNDKIISDNASGAQVNVQQLKEAQEFILNVFFL